ncbi:hypothetical protein DFJ67_6978 [Asanoa ferruginea]|uniref:Antirestriction protein ArdC n=1 Tax=Asanoa ferruginea TaxID=53367 RepID=A0A3D9ZUR3_9ACTN|nr:hypothetical protein [Asanoa ferruginea]REG00918.1 hypothetical protein DFJ67_6978 [Asanoa ferruginea]GIF47501.1 hypothetical protein Afe04nite_20400 [Asanoa ferruginea]
MATRTRRPTRRAHDERGRADERAALITKIKADFDDRLARMAADPGQWVEFIDHVAGFGARYSLGNQILLLVQAAERGITPRYFLPFGRRDGSTGWRAHQRFVRTGEKAFKIWAPVRRRPTEAQAAASVAAGRRVPRDPDGRPSLRLAGFALANTFELSQTDGEPFAPPTIVGRRRRHRRVAGPPALLTGQDPTGVYDDLVALLAAAGYQYALVPAGSGYLGTGTGVTVHRGTSRQVQVRDDIDPAQRTKTVAHELAHIRCGHTDQPGVVAHRGRQETEAESVAHIVLRAVGLDTAAYSDAYVFGWADGDMDLVKDCAETVLRTARQILDDLTPADPERPDEPHRVNPAAVDSAAEATAPPADHPDPTGTYAEQEVA